MMTKPSKALKGGNHQYSLYWDDTKNTIRVIPMTINGTPKEARSDLLAPNYPDRKI